MTKLMIALHTVFHGGKHVPEGKALHVTLEQAEVLVRCNAARPATDEELYVVAKADVATVAATATVVARVEPETPAVVPPPAAPSVATETPATQPVPEGDSPVVAAVTQAPADDVAVATKKKAKS